MICAKIVQTERKAKQKTKFLLSFPRRSLFSAKPNPISNNIEQQITTRDNIFCMACCLMLLYVV